MGIDKVLLEDMSWEEAERAFSEERVVIVPTGSTEQHGPHLPLGTDIITARELAVRVGERTRALVTPTMPFGYAEYHTDFPGTLSVTPDTLLRVLIEITSHLVRYGAHHILFFNGHGGNSAVLHEVGQRLRVNGVVCGMVQWWDITSKLRPEWGFGHGDCTETSFIMALAPDLVDLSRATTPKEVGPTSEFKPHTPWDFFYADGLVHLYYRTRDVTDTGALAELAEAPAEEADREFGEEVLTLVTDYLAKFVRSFGQIPLPT